MANSVPRWIIAITNALAEHEKAVVFQLASIDPTTPVPHVRSHIFRAFISPTSVPSLPLLITTTDIRTPKVSQLTSNPHVQLAWWIEGTQQQYRISGLASVVPTPGHALYKQFVHSVKDAASESAVGTLRREGFDWEEQRKKIFEEMSGYMKATWCRPVPGSPLQGGEETAKTWPVKLEEPTDQDDVEAHKDWEMALGNFALVIIDPTDVDFVELGVLPHRRTRFRRTSNGVWDSEDIVP